MAATEIKTFSTRDFRLQSGIVMPAVTIAYATLGTLAPDRGNAVLVTHGNTSGPQMIDPGGSTGEGSWNETGRPGQGGRYQPFFCDLPEHAGLVLRIDQCQRASIPRPASPTGRDFPTSPSATSSRTQRLLLDHLGIEKLVAIVGPSYGGFQAFQWAVNYPDAMKGIAAVVTSPLVPRERSEGNVARLLGTLSKDPNWNGGDYYDRGGVLETMTQIRMATLKTYGIETRLKSDDVGSRTDRGRDPRRGGAMGRRF